MKEVIFRKLYRRMEEKDYGAIPYSIVVFEKIPYMYESKMLPEEEAIEKGYQVETITTQYNCYLQIDLWIAVLRFQWLTKLINLTS
jgi:hypothetical protein